MKYNTNDQKLKEKIKKEEQETRRKIRIVKKTLQAKNKTSECLKLGVSKSTYYFWRNKYLTTATIKNKSRKPNNSPNKITDKNVIRFVRTLCEDGRGKYYIQTVLKREHFNIGTSAIKGIAKRLGVWKTKKKKTKKRYDKNKYAENIKIAGEIVQIDTKYARIKDRWVYQMTATVGSACGATDLKTKTTWDQIYEEKTPENARKFLEYVVADTPFKIQAVQTDNGSEFTHFADTDKFTQFELACQKFNIKLTHIPVGEPRFNGCVERVHGTYEREFYQKVGLNITIEQMKIELKHFTIFYNTKRLHSALKYNTITENLKILGLPIPISLTP